MAERDHLIAFRANDEDLRLIEAVRSGHGLASSSATIRYGLRLAASQLRRTPQQGEDQVTLLQSNEEVGVERLTAAFDAVIEPVQRVPFGSDALGLRGFSDGNPGVQWNAWIGTHPGLGDENAAYLGVNLEGLKYGGYPVADLLLQEAQRPLVFGAIARVSRPSDVRVIWWMDAWQGAGRLPNFPEHQITPEISLDSLSPEQWANAVNAALKCLDKARDYRGRGRGVVTLRSREKREYPVSPHFQFRTVLWREAPSANEAIAVVRAKKTLLQPLYDFVEKATT